MFRQFRSGMLKAPNVSVTPVSPNRKLQIYMEGLRVIGHYDQFMMVFASHRQPVCLLLGLFRLACAFGMAQVGTLFLLLWRDWGGGITGSYGIAAHRILESGR